MSTPSLHGPAACPANCGKFLMKKKAKNESNISVSWTEGIFEMELILRASRNDLPEERQERIDFLVASLEKQIKKLIQEPNFS